MQKTARQPNILWLIVDHMAFAGHYRQHLPDYHWPHLEALASQGIWYERAYTTVPVCTPARASLMTGQRPSKHGLRWNPEYNILQNLQDFRPGQRLFNHRIAEQGYQTSFVGKWHCGRKKLPADYGMSGWSMPDYGNVYGCDEYQKYLEELNLERPSCRLDHQLFDPALDGQTVLMNPPEPWTYMDGCGVLLGDERTQEQFFVAHRATQELSTLQADDKPWCMVASFWGPHHPYIPSESYAAKIDPAAIQHYPSFSEDLSKKPFRFGIHRDLRCDFRAHERWPDWSTWQTVMARCYAQGLQTDAAIGQLLLALETSGQADDTLVIVTADHGDAIASHGAGWDKYSTYTEEVGRVPLVMRWPEQIPAGTRSKRLVSGLDITATLVAAANADSSGMDGRNLVADDQIQQVQNEHLVVEHYGHSGDVAFQRIVYQGDWKYVVAWGDDDELYNLAEDPYELDNLCQEGAVQEALRRLQQIALDDLLEERAQREEQFPQSEMEFKLVISNDRWPREERLLQYKLESALSQQKQSTQRH